MRRLAFFILAAWLCFPALRAEDKVLPKISVVKTYGELLAAKPVFDEDAAAWNSRQPGNSPYWGKARIKLYLGINGDSFPLHGSAVLFCLVEAPDEINLQPLAEGNALGPFSVDITEPPRIKNLILICKMEQQRKLGGYQLYMKPIPLDQPGTWKIRLMDPRLQGQNQKNPVSIAQASFEVSKEADPRWYPWGLPLKGEYQISDQQKEDGPPRYLITGISNPAGGPAAPWSDGGEAFSVDKKVDPKTPLPQTFTKEPSSLLPLQAGTNRVILKVPGDCGGIEEGRDAFLTRWWLNGKPLVLSEEQPILQDAQSAGGGMARAIGLEDIGIITMEIQFDPQRFGAKEGDEIGLQLLFCPRGWAYEGDYGRMMRCYESASAVLSRMSSRVDFIWKGGKLLPKQEPPP